MSNIFGSSAGTPQFPQIVEALSQYGIDLALTDGLSVTIAGGNCLVGGVATVASAASFTLTDNADNYIGIDQSSGVITNTVGSAPVSPVVTLYKLTTLSGQIINSVDMRLVYFNAFVSYAVGGGGGGVAVSAGTNSRSSGTVNFSNSNGVTFGMNTAGVMTASVSAVAAGAAISGGTNSRSTGTINFSNSNGVSFGMATNGVMTASVASAAAGGLGTVVGVHNTDTVADFSFSTGSLVFGNYGNVGFSSSSSPASGFDYLIANASINISAGTTSENIASIVFANSNGISFGLAAGTVTASAAAGGGGAAISAGTNSTNAGTVVFANSNNISFGMNTAGVITAANNIKVTVAGASAQQSVLQFMDAPGNVSFAVSNASAIYAQVYTGYVADGTASFAGQGATTGAHSGISTSYTHLDATLTANGLSLVMPKFLLATSSTAFAGINSAITSGLMTLNSSGLSLNLSDKLTTARASNDGIGLNTAATNVTWTVNSSGISFNAAGYAGTTTAFAGTNVSASVTMNSAGLNMALSAPAAVGGTTNITSGAVIADSVSTITNGTLVFSNSNGINFGLNGSTMTAARAFISDWLPYQLAASATIIMGQNSLSFVPLNPPEPLAVSAMEFVFSISQSSTSSPAWTNNRVINYGIYNEIGGGTALSLRGSSSLGVTISGSSNASFGLTIAQGTASFTQTTAASGLSGWNQGNKIATLPFVTTLMPSSAPYFLGMHQATATTGTSIANTFAILGNNELSNASMGRFDPLGFTASNKSIIQEPYGFVYSVSSAGLPNSIALSDMSIQSNTQPYIYFEG